MSNHHKITGFVRCKACGTNLDAFVHPASHEFTVAGHQCGITSHPSQRIHVTETDLLRLCCCVDDFDALKPTMTQRH